ncbi:MAG: hypothetical protein JW947_03750 [Sedimentisphaerales bacterium]|nr:hypothetical protein [Sedimentisphaerales bacterium]
MDNSKFKDLILKLGFIRNYSSLILPVIIILVAVLLFIPTQLMSSKLKKEIEDESVSIGERVRSLSKSAVSRRQWEVEREYQQDYFRDANQTAIISKQSGQRQLLSYKIFPKPRDPSVLIFKEFGQRFRDAIDELIARVNAHDCPTAAELQKSLQGSGMLHSYRGREENLAREKMDEVDATITDVLCREKAHSAFVYVNPADLSGYEFWKEYEYFGMNSAIEDCWYWQLAYWIIEDVFTTIDVVNAESESVFTSPVKRLMSLTFDSSGKTEVSLASRPSYVYSSEEAITEPPTGRFSDNDIDIVHFNIAVVVSTKSILPFMRQLCSAKSHKFRGFTGKEQEQVFKHNQITILETNILPVNLMDAAHSLYRYGDDAVVELYLVCEYMFNKSSYDEIKPESVKELLEKNQ